jgi:hypothetical protein
MVRYYLAAGALKVFSANTLTRKLYRTLGNTYGAKKRVQHGMSDIYLHRAKDIIAKCRQFNVLKPGDKILELGTGWVHWESIVLRLFFDIEPYLFDVWDNRQLPAMKEYFRQFEEKIGTVMPMTDAEKKRVHELVGKIRSAETFDDVYKALNAKYVLHPEGSLAELPQNAFSLVFSVSVLEHVPYQFIKSSMDGSFGVLKPGGYAIHMTDLGDHLTLYDPTMEYDKNYLRYTNAQWKWFLQNEVQYFNRVQPAEWRQFFAKAGFTVVEEIAEPISLNGTPVSKSFAHLERRDLETLTLKTVHRKP